MATGVLRQPASVKLDGSGNGFVSLGPLSARETWWIDTVSVSVLTNTSEAQARVYVGDRIDATNYVGGTLTGSTGDTTDTVPSPVKAGHKVWIQWSGGDANSIATAVVTGRREV